MYKRKGLLVQKAQSGLKTDFVSKPDTLYKSTNTTSPLTDESSWKRGAEKFGAPAATASAKAWPQGQLYSRMHAYSQPLDSALQANYPQFAEANKAIRAINPDDVAGRNRVVDSLKGAGHTYSLTPQQEQATLDRVSPTAYQDFLNSRKQMVTSRGSNVLGTNESGASVDASRYGIANSAAISAPKHTYTDNYDDQAGNVYPRSQASTDIQYEPKQNTYKYNTKVDTVYPVPMARPQRFVAQASRRKSGGLLVK